MNRIVLAGKRLSETTQPVPGGVDFVSQLQPTETLIAPATVTVTVYSGVDANPGALLSGPAVISGTRVLQLVTGGVLGVIYEIRWTVTTSLSQVLSLCGYLAIIPDLP